ncbi:MAG TPA: hypothetical protein VLJ39_12230 [Tepidisphaeraceae bacterium]|nr:hypothetical protein [Tepidisphaeraceae bacterium]
MIRVREILDPELRRKIVAALAERRGCSVAAIPEWFELDDLDFVDLLNDLKGQDTSLEPDDPRM